MAANPSKIVVSTSSKADNANNESQALAELEQKKRAQEFEQYKKELIDSRPEIPVSKHNEDFFPLSHYFPGGITNLTVSYLRETEILQLSAIAPPILNACRSEVYRIMGFKKMVSENLLPLVFAANPKGIDEFFKTPNAHPKMLLTQGSYDEGYHSKKLKKFVCFRRWKSISPWKAAFLCGDGPFLGFRLLAYLIDNNLPHHEKENLLWEARQQLGEIKALIGASDEAPRTNNSAVTTLTKSGAGASLAAAAPAMGAAPAAAACQNNTGGGGGGGVGLAEQNRLKAQNTEMVFADSAEFLAPLKILIRAYNNYISQYDSLAEQNKWDEIDKFWGQVGECQKRLPRYVLQEFFSPTPFDPIPEFNTEPSRDECRYWNNDLLDLDELDVGSFIALYKGHRHAPARWAAGRAPRARADLSAVNRLYKLRKDNLRNTFNCLQTLESALTLISNKKRLWIAL